MDRTNIGMIIGVVLVLGLIYWLFFSGPRFPQQTQFGGNCGGDEVQAGREDFVSYNTWWNWPNYYYRTYWPYYRRSFNYPNYYSYAPFVRPYGYWPYNRYYRNRYW